MDQENESEVMIQMENSTAAVKDKKEIRYRHEWKHEISWSDLLAIRQRLRAVAKPD